MRALFDQYAPKFDKTLVKDLDYRGPEILLKAVWAARHAMKLPVHFKRAIDLGCGTGLAAREFESIVDEFIGIDLSPGMIERARATQLYAQLHVNDMWQALRGEPDASADLVMAADAVVYVPDLAPLLGEIARVLKSKALLAFTVETHDGEGVVLGAGLRYAHSADYLRDVITAAKLNVSAIAPASTRMEAGEPVPGLVVTASKP